MMTGMVISTIATLFITPVYYSLTDSVASRLSGLFKKIKLPKFNFHKKIRSSKQKGTDFGSLFELRMDNGGWRMNGGKMGTAVVQCLYNLPAGEYSVLPHPFNDDLGNTVRPWGIRVQMHLQATY